MNGSIVQLKRPAFCGIGGTSMQKKQNKGTYITARTDVNGHLSANLSLQTNTVKYKTAFKSNIVAFTTT